MNNASQIPQLMERLFQVMTDKGMNAPKYLNPGLSRQEILDLTKGIIELPEDVIALYEFVNGTAITRDNKLLDWQIAIMFGYIIHPLQRALDMREEIIRLMSDDQEWLDESDENINGWLPIFAEDGNCYLVDVNRASKEEPCIFHIMKAFDPDIRYTNLESMIRSIIACYEQDAYIVADRRIVKYDIDKIRKIERLYNPGVDV